MILYLVDLERTPGRPPVATSCSRASLSSSLLSGCRRRLRRVPVFRNRPEMIFSGFDSVNRTSLADKYFKATLMCRPLTQGLKEKQCLLTGRSHITELAWL